MTTIVRPEPNRTLTTRVAAEHFTATNAVAERFFGDSADAIAHACQVMADRFQRGGRMFVHGERAQRSDAAHVVVEFVHPVIVGKRALPALRLPDAASDAQQALTTMGRSGDLLMVIAAGALDDAARAALTTAGANGLLTIALTGPVGESAAPADHTFTVPSSDPCIVQETQEMLYHVLWELVHVFFERRAGAI